MIKHYKKIFLMKPFLRFSFSLFWFYLEQILGLESKLISRHRFLVCFFTFACNVKSCAIASIVFWRLAYNAKSFAFLFLLFLLRACDQNWNHWYGMLCAFKLCSIEINSNGSLKRGHVESCPSTTKNIISPLPQCLWPSNLAGWWLTMTASHP